MRFGVARPGIVGPAGHRRPGRSRKTRSGITDDSLPTASGALARKRATPILTRRVKQAIAEWYVVDMREKSWGGLLQHIEQGFNIGKPPYGCQVVVEKHPVPAKAALGKVKRRLVRIRSVARLSHRSMPGGSVSGCRTTRSPTA